MVIWSEVYVDRYEAGDDPARVELDFQRDDRAPVQVLWTTKGSTNRGTEHGDPRIAMRSGAKDGATRP